ncbi:hypothetical protein [Calycomorphotria hydatis]|uniref:Uncharacterized protein n=1 Tax=Calycomorphotria hydatis TaxID=2528027 RepID=A0A517T354_9PLAN|nr:hypothetical protein [Calycomorphotria hydatis]QDT62809.1 hypothetical protein V22_00070 [Calycomorphotria hydatis]
MFIQKTIFGIVVVATLLVIGSYIRSQLIPPTGPVLAWRCTECGSGNANTASDVNGYDCKRCGSAFDEVGIPLRDYSATTGGKVFDRTAQIHVPTVTR